MPVKIERTQFNKNGNVFPSPFEFKQWGQSGIPVSSIFPKVGEMADDLAVVRSMTSKVNEHAQGNYAFHSGFPFMGESAPQHSWLVVDGSRMENELGKKIIELDARPSDSIVLALHGI